MPVSVLTWRGGTVQRWERQEGLPVHRLVHDKLGSVYAFSSELDGWWAERRSRLESDADETTAAVDDTPEPGRTAEPEQKAESEQRADVSPLPESERPGPPHASPWILAGLSVGAALLIAAALAWWAIGRKPQTSTARPVRLAILPFSNLTGDPAREFLSDGLTEELIAGLGRVRDLGVIARTSVMRYKGTDRNWNRRTRADFERGIAFFNQAIAIDRSYAPPYSGLADSYLLLSNYGHMPVEGALPRAKESANKALALDEGLADGHASLGFAVEIYDRDFRVAEQQFERALALNPNHVNARLWYGIMLLNLARFEEARAQFQTGLESDPFSGALRGNMASCDFFAGRYDDAIRAMRAEAEREPDRAVSHLDLGRVYIQKGDHKNGIGALRRARALAGDDPMFDAVLGYGLARAGQPAEAEAILARLMAESGTRRVPPYYLAVLSAGLGRRDGAFRWLDQVLHERHIGALSMAVEPELASLRSDPRFQDLRRRVGLH